MTGLAGRYAALESSTVRSWEVDDRSTVYDAAASRVAALRVPCRTGGTAPRSGHALGIADLVIFDPDTISKATYGYPHQYSVRIPYVIVGVAVVADQSRHTGLLAGQILESTRLNN